MTWQMPTTFPDLSAARGIAVDIETRDDDLRSKGPGVRRGAYVVGVAVVTADGEFAGYYPVAHDEGPNMSRSAVFNWLGGELSRPNQPKIGANLLYDFDFLTHAGVRVGGDRWVDVQNAEPLIDENAGGRYNLDALGQKYLGRGKLSAGLEEACAERGLKGNPASNIWRLPASVVGPYSIEDATLTLDVFARQKKVLHAEGTYDLFKLETYLMPLLLRMRQTGVRIDVGALDKAIRGTTRRLGRAKRRLRELAGFEVQYWAAASLAAAFDGLGLRYGRTPKTGRPSFTKEFLTGHAHPLAALVLEARALDKFSGTFLRGQIRDQLAGDRVHSLFNQQRTDEYGTVTGRFSSSHPNLQFIPSRDARLAPLVRSMFVPELGCGWGKADYSQIEFRIFAHYAVGPGSNGFRAKYSSDPETDFHQWCADVAGIPRREAKNLNFGLLYGMGRRRLASELGMTGDEAESFLNAYHKSLPFIRTTSRAASDAAERRGHVRTLLGRRRRFPKWEPADWNLAQRLGQFTLRDRAEAAVREALAAGGDHGGGVKRAGTYKALNAVVQGSSADMLKKAMVDCWRAGLFEVLTPHLTVHDELDVSVPEGPGGLAAFEEMTAIMRDAVPLRVPVAVDASIKKSWGDQA